MSFVQPVSFSSAPALRFRLSLERQLPSKRPDIFPPHTHNDSSPISALYFSLFPQKTSTKLDLFSTISLSLLTPFSPLPSISHIRLHPLPTLAFSPPITGLQPPRTPIRPKPFYS